LREHELKNPDVSDEEKYSRYVMATKHNLESQLGRCIRKIPELNEKKMNITKTGFIFMHFEHGLRHK